MHCGVNRTPHTPNTWNRSALKFCLSDSMWITPDVSWVCTEASTVAVLP